MFVTAIRGWLVAYFAHQLRGNAKINMKGAKLALVVIVHSKANVLRHLVSKPERNRGKTRVEVAVGARAGQLPFCMHKQKMAGKAITSYNRPVWYQDMHYLG